MSVTAARRLRRTHGGLDGGDVRLGEAGGRRALSGVDRRVGGEGGGAAGAVRVLDVSSAVTTGTTAFL